MSAHWWKAVVLGERQDTSTSLAVPLRTRDAVPTSLTETEFLFARLARLLALAENLAPKPPDSEEAQWFQTITLEIETILERLEMLRRRSQPARPEP